MKALDACAGIDDPGPRCGDAAEWPESPNPATTTRMRSAFLGIWRAFAVGFFSSYALVESAVSIPFLAGARRLRARSGLLVCNHLSYLDVIVLSSIRPCVFVAKHDVAGWPFFGWLARAAGTVFVDRQHPLAAGFAVNQIRAAIATGLPVVLFPEGTSSDGSTVLPFKSSLLESAVQLHCPVAAAAIEYGLDDGSVAEEVCYWRDMTLLPHLLNLFFKREVRSKCSFSVPKIRAGDRKEIARELRDEIVSMRS
ncbi:MAG: hypothetical protein DMF37_03150 [Verrucomicrobia bacterium]|nr:MAG: hypothetical protein DMF37_03150 [Verrucomicrobiota bacterium]